MSWQNFWWAMTVAVIVWYSVVTLYVAIKGALDIKSMLRHLAPNRTAGGFPVDTDSN